jgi:TPR repeat protein
MESNTLTHESRLNWRNVFYMLVFFVLTTLPTFAQSDDTDDLTVDDAKAIVDVMQQKADNGDVEMQVAVAKFYAPFTHGARNDNIEAALYALSMVRKYSKMAADEGDADGMALYAQRLEGDGDLTNAYEWYRMASNLGNGDATCAIGRFYLYGKEQLEIKKNEAKALELFRKSAEQKSPEGMAWLGYCNCMSGNYQETISWYRKSAELGCSFGMAQLCLCYILGLGVDIDIPVAYKWYKRSFETHDASWGIALSTIDDNVMKNAQLGETHYVAFVEYCKMQGDDLKDHKIEKCEDWIEENTWENK